MSRLTLTLALSNIFMTATPSYCSCSRSCGRGDCHCPSAVPSQGQGAGFAGGDAQPACPQQLRAGLHMGSKSPQELQVWGHHSAPTHPGCPHLSDPQQLQDRLLTW